MSGLTVMVLLGLSASVATVIVAIAAAARFGAGRLNLLIICLGVAAALLSTVLLFDHTHLHTSEARAWLLLGALLLAASLAEYQRSKDKQSASKKAEMVLDDMLELTRLAGSGGDIHALAREAAETAARVVSVTRVSVWVTDDDRILRCVDAFDVNQRRHEPGPTLNIDDYPAYFSVLDDSRNLAITDVRDDPSTQELQEYFDELGITSTLEVPVRTAGRPVGMICCEHAGAPRTWTLQEQHYAGAIAQLLAVAAAGVHRRRSERVRDALLRIGEHAQRDIDLTAFLDGVLNSMRPLLQADRAYIALYDSADVPYCLAGIEADNLAADQFLAVMHRKVRGSKRPFRADAEGQESLLSTGELTDVLNDRFWLGSPLLLGERVLGVVAVEKHGADAHIRQDDRELLSLVADRVAVAVERRRSEERLRKRDAFIRSVLDSLTHPFVVLNVDDRQVAMANEAARKLERRFSDACPACQARQKPGAACPHGEICTIDEVVEAGGPVTRRQTLTDSSGRQRHFELHAYPVRDANGDIRQVIEYSLDVSERVQADSQRALFATALDQASEALLITDADGVVKYANPAFRTLLNLPEDSIHDMPVADLPGLRETPLQRRLAQCLGHGHNWRGQFHIRTDGERTLDADAAVSAIRHEGGRISNALVLLRDRTEQTRLEGQLLQAQKMEAIGTLTSGIAHDFNNVLTAIFGYLDLANTALQESHPAREPLRMVEFAAQQASKVVGSMLTFGSDTASEKAPVALDEVIREGLELLRHMLPGAIQIESQLEPNIWINANAIQIQQVVMNLGVNARDAMPRGGILRVQLETTRPDLAPEQNTARLRVSDTGEGMTEDVQRRVFEPFFTTKQRSEGSGLGMAMIHGIVKGHGGRVEIDSSPGKGTRIGLFLPMCVPPRAVAPTPERKPGARTALPARDDCIVLIAPDDLVRSIMASTLRTQGLKVQQASNLENAGRFLDGEGSSTGAVVIDLDLPGGEAIAWAQVIRAKQPDLPLVGLCADPDEAPVATLSNSLQILPKPFQMSELLRVVVAAMNSTAQESMRS